MQRPIRQLFLLSLTVLVLSSCRRGPSETIPGSNSIYHWKTTFDLDEAERDFLERHDIERIYLRYFDVDMQDSNLYIEGPAVPVATTAFKSPKPEGVEIVPTVFITVNALNSIDGMNDLAQKIYTRVLNMTDYNDLGPIREIQLDCDWTSRSKDSYYALCSMVASLAHSDSILVSSTIRLHQLGTNPPPVDKGVLMVYNTGALRDPRTKNSILDVNDVRLYLAKKNLHYGLPLDFAFPVYGWGVLFRDGSFNGIIHCTDYSDRSLYKPRKGGTFIVKKDHMLDGKLLFEGDLIRLEFPSASDVDKVERLVMTSLMHSPSDRGIILYHLDSENLKNFKDNEISRMYSY